MNLGETAHPVHPIFSKRDVLGSGCCWAQKMTLNHRTGMPLHCGSPFLSCLLGERTSHLVPGNQDFGCQLFPVIVLKCQWLSTGRSWDPQGIVSPLVEEALLVLLEAGNRSPVRVMLESVHWIWQQGDLYLPSQKQIFQTDRREDIWEQVERGVQTTFFKM